MALGHISPLGRGGLVGSLSASHPDELSYLKNSGKRCPENAQPLSIFSQRKVFPLVKVMHDYTMVA